MSRRRVLTLLGLAASVPVVAIGAAHTPHGGGLATPARAAVRPAFDIVHTRISVHGGLAVFRMRVSGRAGSSRPAPTGALAGSRVFSYVWPTTLDPAVVGFAPKSGILAFAVTSHRDFDDTPLFDENGDGRLGDDGAVWHSHWVVLAPDATCGPAALKVAAIPAGTTPHLPATWPGLPILIDSPGWSPTFHGGTVTVRVPFTDIGAVRSARFDGVTAALRVNAGLHDPLLCVTDVFKTASGDLSLPGHTD
ncbi:MAG: hypothetical protein U0Y82_02985 [Thermoleophilia bacterium]